MRYLGTRSVWTNERTNAADGQPENIGLLSSPTLFGGVGIKINVKAVIPLRPMPHLRFYRAILSRNFIARQNRAIKSQV